MVSANESASPAPQPRFSKRSFDEGLLRRLSKHKMGVWGSCCLLVVLAFTVVAPFLSSFSPYEMAVRNRLLAPSATYWFGTDDLGRDLFIRIAIGAQVSLSVGFAVACATAILGMIIGLYAAYYSWLDHILMRICDALMGFPSILLAITLMATLGPSTVNVVIALVSVFTPSLARTIRSAALVVKEQTYIEALRSMGSSSTRILWLHIAPNVLSPLITQATFIFAEAIIVEAALSFLGLGVPPPEPSWGSILHDGKIVIFDAWWMTVIPGIFIVLSVLGLNLFGDGLRDVLDPHTSQVKK